MSRIFSWFNVEDWKRGLALVILYAYAWQLAAWGPLTWATKIVGVLLGLDLPGPSLLPWELLATGTATLGTVGGLQKWGEKIHAETTK